MESAALIAGYDTRLRRGAISEANFLARRLYFRAFRARHLPSISEIPREGEIIDAGCFTGSKTQSLISRYPQRIIRGIDINNTALEVAQQRFPSQVVKFEHGDIRTLQESVSDAAMIFSSQVFHHLEKPERLRALEAIFQSLRESGKFVISDTFLDIRNPVYRLLVAFYERIAQCPYTVVMPHDIVKEAESVGLNFVRAHHTLPGEKLWEKFGMYPSSMLTFVK